MKSFRKLIYWAITLCGLLGEMAYAGDIYKVVDKTTGEVTYTNLKLDPRQQQNKVYKLSSYTPARIKLPYIVIEKNRINFHPLIIRFASQYQVSPALLHAVITAESGYNPSAVSVKGAVGLMQLMPRTANQYGVVDIYDPAENIRGGTQHLRGLLRMFNNNLPLALAAYNAGENAVAKYGNTIPPYRETKNYVQKVVTLYNNYKKVM